jgi:hypothetical protein
MGDVSWAGEYQNRYMDRYEKRKMEGKSSDLI